VAFDPADPANRALAAHVRPPDWAPPSPAARYDLLVIGGGTAGLVCAAGAAGLGARVALVERDRLGGDCLNTGCVPSKALLAAAGVAAVVRDARAFGVRAALDGVDFPEVMRQVRAARARVAPHDAAARFAALGVDVFFGHARFIARDAIVVADHQRLSFSRAVIATGGRPSLPPVDGLEAADPLTTESVFELTARPDRLMILGGGPTGCELAQAFARLGSRVQLVERAARLLPREHARAGGVARDSLTADGVAVRCGAEIHHVERRADGVAATWTLDGIVETTTADRVLVAAGRRPNTDGLDLAAAGIDVLDDGRVQVNDHLQTRNRRVYAAGDVCLPWQFTHAADASARLVLQNALFAGWRRVSRVTLPRTIYTDPEIASVGVEEDDPPVRGSRVTVFELPFADLDRAIVDGRTSGFVRLLAGRDGRLVGATIAGPRAGELVAEVAVAMAGRVGLGTLADVVHPYPGYAEILRRAGDAFNRSRLTPRVAAVLGAWLRLRRLT
jgi:pyruvate/2-oxoglutarate dehydrogenase complex dihydrolipoamide dehydrogenase (E3) component